MVKRTQMFNRDDDKKDSRSLLSISGSDATHGEPAAGPFDPLAAQHRRQRSRRQAGENAFLKALARGSPQQAEKTPDSLRERILQNRAARARRSGGRDAGLLSLAASATSGDQAYDDREMLDENRLQGEEKRSWRMSRQRLDAPTAQRRTADADGRELAPAMAGDLRSGTGLSAPRAGDPWQPLIDPVAVFRGIMRSKSLIAGMTVAGALLGIFVALNTPKMYYSAAQVLIDPRDIKASDRELTSGNLPTEATAAIIENQIKIMYSGMVIDRVVERLNLDRDPEFNGGGGGSFLSEAIGIIRSLLSRGGGAGDSTRRLALTKENVAENLEISRSGKTFVVSVGFQSRDGDKSALVANTVVDVFVDAAGDLQSGTAGRAESEFSSRLESLRAELRDAERKAETYRAQHDLVDAKGGLISDNEIIRLNDQLAAARARTIELSARAESARNLDTDAVVSASLPEAVSSAVLSELRAQYARIMQQVDSARTNLGPRHPQLQQLEAQLESAREQITAELRRTVTSIQVELKRAVQQEQALASRLAQLKARQANVGDDLVQLRELEREAAARRSVYENYLLRARESGEQKGINTANISVISKATPPLLASGMSRSTMVVAFTIMGFMAGVGLGAGRGALESIRGRFGGPAGFSADPVGRSPSQQAWQPAPSGRGRRTWRAERVPDERNQPAPQPASAPVATPQPVMRGVPPPPQPAAYPVSPAWPYPPGYAYPPHVPAGYWPQAGFPPAPSYWPPAPPVAPAVQTEPPVRAAGTDDADLDDLRRAVRDMRAKVRDLTERRNRTS